MRWSGWRDRRSPAALFPFGHSLVSAPPLTATLGLMPDQPLIVTPEILHRLSVLRSEPKFNEENLYPGAPAEEIRLKAERAVNAMLDRLVSDLRRSPQKSYVLSEFLDMLRAFEHEDTEERGTGSV